MGSEFTVELWIQTFTAVVNVETLTTLLTETCFMFLTDPDRLSVGMVSASHHFFSIAGSRLTPLESLSIPACPALGRDRGRQKGMQWMGELKTISSLPLPAGRP